MEREHSAAEERARKAEDECTAAQQGIFGRSRAVFVPGFTYLLFECSLADWTDARGNFEASAVAEKEAISKSILADAATRKLQMLGVSVPDTDAAVQPVAANTRRAHFWHVAGDEDALPAPTTFLRQTDALEVSDGQTLDISAMTQYPSYEDVPAAVEDEESENTEAKAAPWVLRERAPDACSLESSDDKTTRDRDYFRGQEPRSHQDNSQKPLARGLYSKLFAGKKREALTVSTPVGSERSMLGSCETSSTFQKRGDSQISGQETEGAARAVADTSNEVDPLEGRKEREEK